MAITLLAAVGDAFAITATIWGTYGSGEVYDVEAGQVIKISGDCKVVALEVRNPTEWQVGNNPREKIQNPGTTTTHTFTVEGAEGTQFDVTMYCHTASLLHRDDQASRTFRIPDRTPPAVSWNNTVTYADNSIVIDPTVIDAASYIVGDAQLRWTGNSGGMSPGIRIVQTELIDDTGRAARFRYELNTSGMSEGRKEVQIRTADVAGNDTGWIPLGHFTVDRTPPSLSDMTVTQSATSVKAGMPQIADAVSGVEQVWIRWQTGSGWSSGSTAMHHDGGGGYSYEIDTRDINAGIKKIEVWARDKAGNDTGWKEKGSFSTAHAKPQIDWGSRNAKFAKDSIRISAYVYPAPGFSVTETRIWWNGAPGDGYAMQNDGGGNFSYTVPTSGMPDRSRQNIMFLARDNGGETKDWVTPYGAWFTVDRSAPSIQWDSTNPAYANDGISINADISDAASGVKDVWITWTGETSKNIRMNKGSGNRYSYPIPSLPEGVKDVQIWASDNLGNATGWVSKGRFTVDKTAPVVNWLAPLDQAVLTGDSIRVAGNVVEEYPEAVTIEWQAEGETAWQSHTEKMKAGGNDFEYMLQGLKRGVNYRVRLQAVDKAGNTSAVTPARSLIGQLAANVLFKNGQLAVLDKSLVDKDNSGSLSAGDELIYSIALEAAGIPATGLSLRYALPDGLSPTPSMRPYFALDSAIKDGTQLNVNWNGGSDAQLLADGVDLPAGKQLIMQIPVTITSPLAAPVASTALAGARNARDELRLEHSLALQDKYPAHRALDLALASMQPDWKYLPGTAFDYRITLHVREWDLSDVELRYALPPGLERNGDMQIEGDGASAVTLNPAWGNGGGSGEVLLLSSVSGARLPAGHTFDVIVPVKIGAGAKPGSAIQSDIEIRASNLDGPVKAMHRITLEASTEPEEQLALEKTVDKRKAAPGEMLRYTIRFKNVGIDTLHDPVIEDSLQTGYLTLKEAQCDASISIDLHCSVVKGLPPGRLEWRLDGKLEPGDFGSVSYEAIVNRQ